MQLASYVLGIELWSVGYDCLATHVYVGSWMPFLLASYMGKLDKSVLCTLKIK